MIERLSSLAPAKDIKRYYLRDALGQLIRICNDTLDNIFDYEYCMDFGGKELAKEYHISDSDGWTFATTYITRLFVRSEIELEPFLEKMFNSILVHTIKIINCDQQQYRQIEINDLQYIITHYPMKVDVKKFMKDISYIIYEYNHESLLGFVITLMLALIIQNEYNPYSISYLDNNKKWMYNYREIRFAGGKICDFRDLNVEQSSEFCTQEKIDAIDKYFPQVKKTGQMKDFNAAFSFGMLRSIRSKYSHAFQMPDILAAHRHMLNQFVELFITTAARYSDNTYRLFTYTKVDPDNQILTDYINNNKNRWHIDLFVTDSTQEEAINIYYIEAIRRRLAFVMANNVFDITNRTRLFATGTTIRYTSQSRLLNNKEIEFFIYEYLYQNKFHLFISIKTDTLFNYYILREGDRNVFQQAYSYEDFLLLCAALYLIGNNSFDEYLTNKFQTELIDIWRDEAEKRNNLLDTTPDDDHIAELMIEVFSEANSILNSKTQNNQQLKNKKVYVSELYSEEIKFAPFLRKLPINMKPSDEAIKLAAQLKFTLPAGYTIVREHTRNIKKKK